MTKEDYSDYVKTMQRGEHKVLKPGDAVPIKGISVKVLTAATATISRRRSKERGQPNPYCATTPKREPDPTENAQSLGVLVTFEKFRFLDLGDLTWNKELELMCPNNPIGTVDVLLVSHHGLNQSNSPALVDAVHPRVAIMNNGARKGAQPGCLADREGFTGSGGPVATALRLGGRQGAQRRRIRSSPTSMNKVPGQYIKLTAEGNGSFTISNQRNKFVKIYKAAERPAGK